MHSAWPLQIYAWLLRCWNIQTSAVFLPHTLWVYLHSRLNRRLQKYMICSVKQRDNGALWSFKVTEIGTYWKPVGDFLLVFYCNYAHIFYRFQDLMTYWSNITIFLYPTCIQCLLGSSRNFATIYICGKARIVVIKVAIKRWKIFYDILSHFHTR